MEKIKLSRIKKLEKVINGFEILEDFGYSNGSRRASVVCKVCRRIYEVDPNKLIYRKHCGCMKRGSIVCRYAKSHPRLAQTYKHMIGRCYNQSNQDYYNYGERGIKVCREWKEDRNKFCEWALNNGYKDNLTIDRIDFTKDYDPENCRWADAKTQSRNSRRNVLTMEKAIKIREEYGEMTMKQLSEKYKASQATIWLVIHNKIWVD